MLIYFDERDFVIGVGILCVLLPVLWRQKRSLSYLLFFSVFWAYLLVVVNAVLFPIVINTDYGSTEFTSNINLIPFYFGDCSIFHLCIKGIIDNVVLTIPFGFGISFLVRIKARDFVWLPLAVGLVFELSQLIISLTFRSGFRAVDINDVLLNGTGVLTGYLSFRLFAWIYLRTAEYLDFRYKVIGGHIRCCIPSRSYR